MCHCWAYTFNPLYLNIFLRSLPSSVSFLCFWWVLCHCFHVLASLLYFCLLLSDCGYFHHVVESLKLNFQRKFGQNEAGCGLPPSYSCKKPPPLGDLISVSAETECRVSVCLHWSRWLLSPDGTIKYTVHSEFTQHSWPCHELMAFMTSLKVWEVSFTSWWTLVKRVHSMISISISFHLLLMFFFFSYSHFLFI